MKSIFVLLALAVSVLAAPQQIGESNLEMRQTESESGLESSSVITEDIPLVKERVAEKSVADKSVADTKEKCVKQVKVTLCNKESSLKSNDALKSTTLEDIDVPLWGDDVAESIKIAKEAVENLQKDLQKMELKSTAQTDTSDLKEPGLHDDIEIARKALENVHRNFGNLESMDLVATTAKEETSQEMNFKLANTEEERMAQWQRAIENIEKNVEIARNIEDSFKTASSDAVLVEQTTSSLPFERTEDSSIDLSKDRQHDLDMTKQAKKHYLASNIDPKIEETLPRESLPEPHSSLVEKIEIQHEEEDMKSSASEPVEFKMNLEKENLFDDVPTVVNQQDITVVPKEPVNESELKTTNSADLQRWNQENLLRHNNQKEQEQIPEIEEPMINQAPSLQISRSANEMDKIELPVTENHEEHLRSNDDFRMEASETKPTIIITEPSNEVITQENREKEALNKQGEIPLLREIEDRIPNLNREIEELITGKADISHSMNEEVKPFQEIEMKAAVPLSKAEHQSNSPTHHGHINSFKSDSLPSVHLHHHHNTEHHHALPERKSLLNQHHHIGKHSNPLEPLNDRHFSHSSRSHGHNMAHFMEPDSNMQPSLHMNMRDPTEKSALEYNNMMQWGKLYGSARSSYGAAPVAPAEVSSSGAIGVFPNAKVGNCAIPLLLSCNPSVVSGSLAKPHSYGAPSSYRMSEEFPTLNKRDTKITEAKKENSSQTKRAPIQH